MNTDGELAPERIGALQRFDDHGLALLGVQAVLVGLQSQFAPADIEQGLAMVLLQMQLGQALNLLELLVGLREVAGRRNVDVGDGHAAVETSRQVLEILLVDRGQEPVLRQVVQIAKIHLLEIRRRASGMYESRAQQQCQDRSADRACRATDPAPSPGHSAKRIDEEGSDRQWKSHGQLPKIVLRAADLSARMPLRLQK